jgi:nitrite reductase/ring-hydroxylating ferredoxin subunit
MADTAADGPQQRADGAWDVCPAEAVSAGGMLGIAIGERKILLARSDDQLVALDGFCPHAGAPLAEGVRCGDRVICPWHKASFDLRSGALIEPPAVDPLPRYPVRVENGRVLVSLEPVSAPTPAPSPGADQRCFVILGAGAAGQAAAQRLREEGFGGRLVMASREPELPYDRTVLSKYKLSGEPGGEKSPLQPADFYAHHRAPISAACSCCGRRRMPMRFWRPPNRPGAPSWSAAGSSRWRLRPACGSAGWR